MADKTNPWLDEGQKYDQENKQKEVRELKFQDNKTHTVRVVQKKEGDIPFCGYKQHWIPQNGSTTGKPITHGIDERCGVCNWVSTQWDEIHRLKEEEDMTDKSPEVVAVFEKQQKVAAKTKYDMNVLHREDLYVINKETGEKILAPKRMCAGSTVYKEIFGYAKKWGSPSNAKSGYDLEIKTTGAKERREYSVIPDRNASPLTEEEIKSLDKCFTLDQYRKTTSISDIKKILENAKSPYNEILSFIKEDGIASIQTVSSKSQDNPVEVEKEINQAIKSEPKKEEKKSEPVKEEPKKEEPKKEEVKPAPVDDEHNIEVYECKGDHDENDQMCVDCPVKTDCEEIHPIYVKAKQLGVNIDPHRRIAEIKEDVKKLEEPAKPVRGKKIPF